MQDDEYLASLQADREKELKAIEEAEARRQEDRLKEEESQRKFEEEQVLYILYICIFLVLEYLMLVM